MYANGARVASATPAVVPPSIKCGGPVGAPEPEE